MAIVVAVPVESRLTCVQATVASAYQVCPHSKPKEAKHQVCDFGPEPRNLQITASRPCLSDHGNPHREAFSARSLHCRLQIRPACLRIIQSARQSCPEKTVSEDCCHVCCFFPAGDYKVVAHAVSAWRIRDS